MNKFDVYQLYDILIITPVYIDEFDDLVNLFIEKRDELFDQYYKDIKRNKLDIKDIPKIFFEQIFTYYKPTKTQKEVLDFFTEVVSQNGLNLEYVPDVLKFIKFDSGKKIGYFNIETTLSEIAVRQNGLAIKFVPYKKVNRNDYEDVAEIAIKQNILAKEFVHKFYYIKIVTA